MDRSVNTGDRQTLDEPMSIHEAQAVAQGILDELDRFCTDHGIPYYLIGGALIGAIRSKDFLPWDDDIDIAMKRSDYERFCREYADGGRFRLLTYRRSGSYRHAMAKLIDTTTVLIEPTSRDGKLGVYIDIFALDRVRSPDDRRAALLALEAKMYNYAHVINSTATRGSFLKSFIRILLRATIGLCPHARALARIESAMAKGSGGYLRNYWGAWGKKECVSAECFESAVPVEFSGKLYPAPIGYDTWLTCVYGDYLTPPPNPPHYHGHAYRADVE